jgi:hypothetical protein
VEGAVEGAVEVADGASHGALHGDQEQRAWILIPLRTRPLRSCGSSFITSPEGCVEGGGEVEGAGECGRGVEGEGEGGEGPLIT